MESHKTSSGGETSGQKVQTFRTASPVPSCVSIKSDNSVIQTPKMSRDGDGSGTRLQTSRAHSPVPSCVSMKSDNSIIQPPKMCNDGDGSETSMRTHTLPHDQLMTEAHHLTKKAKIMHQDIDQQSYDLLHRVSKRHKTSMKDKYESLYEGTQENKTLLNRIYTELYIIEGESEGVNKEHEVLLMENKLRKRNPQGTSISCLHIFKKTCGDEAEDIALMKEEECKSLKVPEFRTVLTKGIAGIGKTVSVQKFILDWAEGTANQDVDFMFVLPFREMNLMKDDQYSLHQLLCVFHPEMKDLDLKMYNECKLVFIFDGLDESRIPLNFSQCERICDVSMTSSVGVLMSNLITGELLPSAHIWITSRPAAANQIPPQYVNRVTEIQGFNDPQKEEYFRKRISDQDQAQKIISHIKTAKSLHIMCHIPVFCWISATVLQKITMRDNYTEIPKTLTEMYTHFLLTHINLKQQKYESSVEEDLTAVLRSNRVMLLKLSELAYTQLMKGNVMFYEEELRECGIDVTDASVFSGICTEIFKEESMLYQRKVYCFVHLSFQEFLAAFYLFHCYVDKNMEALKVFKQWRKRSSEKIQLDELLVGLVDEIVESQNGHLDLFLRFLLGISLEFNQRLLQDLLTQTHSSSEGIGKTVKHIKNKIKTEDLSTEKSINLFLCLAEVNDKSFMREIQEYMKSEKRSGKKLSPAHCSAVCYIMSTSEEVLDELDQKKFNTSWEGYSRLIPAVNNCRKARFAGCNLSEESFKILASFLQLTNSPLRELDLSNNDLQDSGVKLLSDGLKSSDCKLVALRLAGCKLSLDACKDLGSVLQSADSALKELDLSNNNLQDAGMKVLSDGLKCSQCKLEVLRLAFCSLGEQTCEYVASVLQSADSPLRELDLSNNDLQDSGVKVLSDGLKSSHCKLEILWLSGCMITEEGCSYLASALSSNPSHLKELDLTYNHPGDSGVKLLTARLMDPQCKLGTLRMEHQGGKIRIKQGLRKYTSVLTVDLNTAHTLLSVSEDNRKVTCMRTKQSYSDHPERFDVCKQVLCRESLTGRCYWEVEYSDVANIAVTYKGMDRKGLSDDSWFGFNANSWSLYCSNNRYFARHNNNEVLIHVPPSSSSRVGVYLDWPAGNLSFYSISSGTSTPAHLHTFQSTFTEPLYAGFGFDGYDSVCVCVS